MALPCTGVKEIPATPSKFFLAGYNSGLLKQNEKYKWHYFVKRLLSPTDTIVDIGANLGYFSIIFSKIINDNGILYSVEPVKPYRDLLESKLPVRNNIKVLPFALGDKMKGRLNSVCPNAAAPALFKTWNGYYSYR